MKMEDCGTAVKDVHFCEFILLTQRELNQISSIASKWLVKHFIALEAMSFVIITVTEE